MSIFKLHKPYEPSGDQPKAIEALNRLLNAGSKHQTLLGVTGSGKTFTMANVIANLGRPALVISHNKTLAAQLYQEFKIFFPENAVHYFVSYYDYYQPEAYIPQSDTYIAKDAKINDFIDAMRHATTATALTRRDFVIVASVSCIYGIGDPEEYQKAALEIKSGLVITQRTFLKKLVELQYERNDYENRAGVFGVKGEIVEIFSPAGNSVTKIEWNGNLIEKISITPYNSPFIRERNKDAPFPLTKGEGAGVRGIKIFPAKHFVTPREKLEIALTNIETELQTRIKELQKSGKILEAERIKQRTNFDLKMLRETGYTHGIENYSRQLSFRNEGDPPKTLLDYLPTGDFITFIDESHMTIPQIRGMYNGDRARKQVLVDYGFRLPSALDNRPLKFDEFNKKIGQVVYMSATPSEYELKLSCEKENSPSHHPLQPNRHYSSRVVEQIIRPTFLLDPLLEIRRTKKQIKDVISKIKKRVAKKERVVVTTLTKKMAEDLADFLKEERIKAEYIHSDIKTIERHKIITELRKGSFDVIVGINLLREGIDLPEVSLVIILDADKEGFLRNAQTLIQTIGRAARHTEGTVIMYADKITDSMKKAVEETERRRKIQKEFNIKNGLSPNPIKKEITENIFGEVSSGARKKIFDITKISKTVSEEKLKEELGEEMLEAAKELNFERAAELRDLIDTL